ncbi:hypothetical protein [Methylacidimicrobium sp. B4]|nr:hypothetical protein [Methylacidimicrobium sp. B4]QSR84696.1 hypothetical protein MacB4_10995 [Methylacidimicrobium sp. B4]
MPTRSIPELAAATPRFSVNLELLFLLNPLFRLCGKDAMSANLDGAALPE